MTRALKARIPRSARRIREAIALHVVPRLAFALVDHLIAQPLPLRGLQLVHRTPREQLERAPLALGLSPRPVTPAA